MTTEQMMATSAELLDIADRLRVIKERFDTHAEKCGGCGLMHARNHTEKKAADQIDGAVGRLEKVVEYLGDGIDEAVQPARRAAR